MALKDLFTMAKADRYTQDGRDQLIKAQEVETEDRRYKNGEISEKTGLMKTPKGWVKPKTGNAGSAKKEEGITGANGNLSERAKFAYENQAKKLSTEGLESVVRNKDKVFAKHNDEIAEIYKKELESRKSKTSGSKPVAKFDEYGLPSNETIAMKDKFLKEENVADPSKLTNKEFNALAEKLDKKLGINNKERAQELLVAESEQSKPATTKAPKPSVQEYMKAQDTVKKYDETYKKQLEEYENGQRLRANGGGAILDPMYGLKPNDLSKNEEYQKAKDIIQRMEAEDAAPRVLTGDCKIRIRK